MKCPNCQHVENRPVAMFCPGCGSLLRPVDSRAYLLTNHWIRWKDGTVTFPAGNGRPRRHPPRSRSSIVRRLLRCRSHR